MNPNPSSLSYSLSVGVIAGILDLLELEEDFKLGIGNFSTKALLK